jgi:hypothetical protein
MSIFNVDGTLTAYFVNVETLEQVIRGANLQRKEMLCRWAFKLCNELGCPSGYYGAYHWIRTGSKKHWWRMPRRVRKRLLREIIR